MNIRKISQLIKNACVIHPIFTKKADEESTGFVPGTKNRQFNVILSFETAAQDWFDIILSPDECKNEKEFLNTILKDIEPVKLLSLRKISVSQSYTSSESQLVDFLKKHEGKWYFKK